MTFITQLADLIAPLCSTNSCQINYNSNSIIQPKTTGEQKTKPTQMSVRQLGGLGIPPDLVSNKETFDPIMGSFLYCKLVGGSLKFSTNIGAICKLMNGRLPLN